MSMEVDFCEEIGEIYINNAIREKMNTKNRV